MDWAEIIKFLIALFVIVNPIGAVPTFLGMTEGHTIREQRGIAAIASAAAFVVLLFSVFAGNLFLAFFGITIPAFRIAAGILIFMMAMAMLQAKRTGVRQTPEESEEARQRDDIAIVPLGIPIIAGPGAISTVIVAADQSTDILYKLSICGCILLVTLVLWVVLFFAPRIGQILGKTGVLTITRLMGLVLAAVAVEFVIKGLTQTFPGLLIHR